MRIKGTIDAFTIGETLNDFIEFNYRVIVHDYRDSQPVMRLSGGHTDAVLCVQMDDWKVVSGRYTHIHLHVHKGTYMYM